MALYLYQGLSFLHGVTQTQTFFQVQTAFSGAVNTAVKWHAARVGDDFGVIKI